MVSACHFSSANVLETFLFITATHFCPCAGVVGVVNLLIKLFGSVRCEPAQ